MSEGMVRKLVRSFKDGRTNVHDEERSGRLSVITEDLVQKIDGKFRALRFHLNLMSFLKFQEVCFYGIIPEHLNYQISGGQYPSLGDQLATKKEPLFSRKIQSGARNHLSPAAVKWGSLRQDRAHRVKLVEANLLNAGFRIRNSRSVVQYLDNWRDVSDRRGMDIFNKLRTLCNSCVFHLQWIPSHVNLKYNDIADSLAKEGTSMPQTYVEPLTYLELYSRLKALVNISWRHPPAHPWYLSEGPGAAIHFKWDRKDQKPLARLSSGHLKTLRFSRGDKKFNICTKCNMIEVTPQHLLGCVALVYDDLLKRLDFVLEMIKANDLMGLI
ncbi:hypothetical protein AVEN_86135-1 [Araneus ventricosus]|uniref:RNase H type-1 domain-containing protein n=1 Tax=Araneus ventricosus TaxID=182803 RepID=A0A4Y2SFF9_ARAVE|nr:hypothetical protein AVEN_86135-1 [Araneus ventricosus]